MIKITRFLYVHWLVLPLIFLSWLTDGLFTLLTAYAVVTVHELFHLFAALILKERVGSLIIMPFGMTVRLSARTICHLDKEMAIAAAGPLANVIMLMLCPFLKAIYGNTPASLVLFQILNIMVLTINLLPCLPLDGGRIVKAICIKKVGYLAAMSIMRRLSRFITILLCVSGILLLLVTRLNVSLLIIAGFLALHMAEEQRQNEYVIMQELLYNKKKLYKRGAMRSHTICATENTCARSVFKMLDYNSYYIVAIVSNTQKPLRFVTEAQIVDAILQKGWHILLSDV
ncbi:MAG: hypothetical protein E7393_06270 [Ruminococcaceae bacterium]|nr:hypothetical protein [Oscillospiraceae bacterium]